MVENNTENNEDEEAPSQALEVAVVEETLPEEAPQIDHSQLYVCVADSGNDRIQKFTAQGDYLTAFGTTPSNPGHTAMAVAVCHDGAVWSVNFADNRVGRWQPD